MATGSIGYNPWFSAIPEYGTVTQPDSPAGSPTTYLPGSFPLFKTGERTLVQYLLKPLVMRVSASMKEN